jgi:hypothetical protein
MFPQKEEGIPENGIGSFVISRSTLVNSVLDDAETTTSQYFRAIPGAGKTVLLHLIGREAQSRGFRVYFVRTAASLVRMDIDEVDRILEDMQREKKLVLILVDEVQAGISAAAFHALLKEPTKNPYLRVIGAGLVGAQKWSSPQFKKKYPSEMLLQLGKGDLEEVCDQMGERHPHMDRLLLEVVVDQVYIFTNGLMLPLLSFIDHVSSNIGTIVPCHLLPVEQNNVDLISTKVYAYLRSAAFNKTDIWIRVSERFTSVVHLHKRAIIEYLSFRLSVDSQTELEHFGCLIGNEMPPILSAFAINNIFKQPVESSSAFADEQVELSLQNCILGGLRTMTLDDFEEPTSAVNFRYENAIGFRWLTHLSRNIPHVYVSPQTQVIREEHLLRRGANPTVDILLNGIMDCALELARCGATRGGNRQKYLNEKALKCITGPYRHWGNQGIFVVEFNNQDPVLPELNIVDEGTGETVCTAALQEKVFTFVFPTNTLYCGNKIVKRGAVNHLPSAPPKRQFSTCCRPSMPAKASSRRSTFFPSHYAPLVRKIVKVAKIII